LPDQSNPWLHLFDLTVSPDLTDKKTPCFVAWELENNQPRPAQEERISQRRLPFGEVVAVALTGEICDAASVSLVLAVQARLARGGSCLTAL
jgi:hypothetical protein